MQQTVVSILTSHDVQFFAEIFAKKEAAQLRSLWLQLAGNKVVAKPFRALRLAPGRGFETSGPTARVRYAARECGVRAYFGPEGRSLKPQRCFCG